MKLKATYAMPFRRRKEGKTNYKKRLASVKSALPRLCVRKSNRYITAQFTEFSANGDKVLAQASSKELAKFGWLPEKNLPSAYLTGMLAATRAKKSGVKQAILDIGFRTPVHGSRVFAALKGALDSDMNVKFEASALPSDDRVSGKHIEEFAKSLGEEDFKKKFSKYAEKGVNVKELSKVFEEVKQKMLKDGET